MVTENELAGVGRVQLKCFGTGGGLAYYFGSQMSSAAIEVPMVAQLLPMLTWR